MGGMPEAGSIGGGLLQLLEIGILRWRVADTGGHLGKAAFGWRILDRLNADCVPPVVPKVKPVTEGPADLKVKGKQEASYLVSPEPLSLTRAGTPPDFPYSKDAWCSPELS